MALIFFLWRHFTTAHERDLNDAKSEIEKEKAELMKKISEVKRSADSRGAQEISQYQQQLARM